MSQLERVPELDVATIAHCKRTAEEHVEEVCVAHSDGVRGEGANIHGSSKYGGGGGGKDGGAVETETAFTADVDTSADAAAAAAAEGSGGEGKGSVAVGAGDASDGISGRGSDGDGDGGGGGGSGGSGLVLSASSDEEGGAMDFDAMFEDTTTAAAAADASSTAVGTAINSTASSASRANWPRRYEYTSWSGTVPGIRCGFALEDAIGSHCSLEALAGV
jgi:hypothetical protein